MKKFIIKVLLFLMPIIAFFGYVEFKLSRISNSYSKKKELFEKQMDSTKVLVLGSSSVLYGINPEFFSQPGFNLANVSQTLYYDRRLVEQYVDRMPRLKEVFIAINMFSLFGQLHSGAEEWRDYFYYHFWGITYKDIPIFDARRYSYIALYSKEIAEGYVKVGFRVDLAPKYTRFGWVRNDSNGQLKRISDSLGRVRANYHNNAFSTKEIGYIAGDLDSFVALLKKKNINVVFISTPAFQTYTRYRSEAIVHLNDSIVNNICQKYSCRYYDYSTDNRFVIDDYYDNDHLNFLGAEKFSRIVDSEIIRPSFNGTTHAGL